MLLPHSDKNVRSSTETNRTVEKIENSEADPWDLNIYKSGTTSR